MSYLLAFDTDWDPHAAEGQGSIVVEHEIWRAGADTTKWIHLTAYLQKNAAYAVKSRQRTLRFTAIMGEKIESQSARRMMSDHSNVVTVDRFDAKGIHLKANLKLRNLLPSF